MSKDSLGDRMKAFENCYRLKLPSRLPVIIRLDGKSFHSYTKGCARPYDTNLIDCMNDTAKYLCEKISGACLAYVQSDEISILLNNFKSWETQPLFDNNIQKIVSVSAGMASAYFSSISDKIFGKIKLATFDSRVFVTSLDEVCNVFEWRQQDAIRNSVQMLARTHYSESNCFKKNNTALKQMLLIGKGIDWNSLPTCQKRGRCIVKSSKEMTATNKKTNEVIVINKSFWEVDNEIPIFSQDRNYIDKYLKVNEQ